MEIIMPELGVFFWTMVAFLIVWFILRKFAWKPILNMLHERDQSIEDALNAAENAKIEMKQFEEKNQQLLKEAKLEREKLLKEAEETQKRIMSEARESAKAETNKMIEQAHKTIKADREAAFAEMKNEIVDYSIQIAEKILRQTLDNKEEQKKIAEQYMSSIKVN
ncbi:MAG: F0F1 ATP synthase subunit B [Salinivirgaceae bacterium]